MRNTIEDDIRDFEDWLNDRLSAARKKLEIDDKLDIRYSTAIVAEAVEIENVCIRFRKVMNAARRMR